MRAIISIILGDMKSFNMDLHVTVLTVTTKNSNRKHMKNKRARKGDIALDEMRNIINEGFHVFQLYMKMKLQPTGFEDEEMIEESINVFKHYMLSKIDE